MKATTFIKTLLSAAIAFAVAATCLADIPIRFAKGRNSATINGKVAKGGRICYHAKAKTGQTFTASLISRSGKVVIFESGETTYTFQVEIGGDQYVCVDNLAGATTYSLTVSVN